MRLIDADEFAIEEPKLWDWSSVNGISSAAVLKQCIWDIQCAPTVEAIPIEWIKDFANNIWWEDERAVIEDMLEHWEKWDEDDTTGKGTAYHRRIDETV